MDISEFDRECAKEVVKRFGLKKEDKWIFYDLVFCICAPQTTFVNNRKVIDVLISKNFFEEDISESSLQEILKPVRFYRNKAKWVLEAKKRFSEIMWVMSQKECGNISRRNWLAKNVKGLGMKAASHFLRNLGDLDLAIIDTHILKFLNIVKTEKWNYVEVEKQFQEKAREANLTPAELDAIVWKTYSKTEWKDFLF